MSGQSLNLNLANYTHRMTVNIIIRIIKVQAREDLPHFYDVTLLYVLCPFVLIQENEKINTPHKRDACAICAFNNPR